MRISLLLEREPFGKNRGRIVGVEQVDHRVEPPCRIAADDGGDEMDQPAVAPCRQADEARISGQHTGGERIVGLSQRQNFGTQFLANDPLQRQQQPEQRAIRRGAMELTGSKPDARRG